MTTLLKSTLTFLGQNVGYLIINFNFNAFETKKTKYLMDNEGVWLWGGAKSKGFICCMVLILENLCSTHLGRV